MVVTDGHQLRSGKPDDPSDDATDRKRGHECGGAANQAHLVVHGLQGDAEQHDGRPVVEQAFSLDEGGESRRRAQALERGDDRYWVRGRDDRADEDRFAQRQADE